MMRTTARWQLPQNYGRMPARYLQIEAQNSVFFSTTRAIVCSRVNGCSLTTMSKFYIGRLRLLAGLILIGCGPGKADAREKVPPHASEIDAHVQGEQADGEHYSGVGGV